MVRSLVRFLSSTMLVSVALVAMPVAAPAQEAQATDLHFNTSITQVYGSPYPLTGRLDLQVFPAGHLRGYYHTSYYKLFIPVVGGRDGDYIWLDIGPSSVDLGLGAGPEGRLYIVGTMNADGSFSGQVFPQQAASLAATTIAQEFPSPQPTSNDQYIIKGTPVGDSAPTPAP
ncbi:MAG TPA: hypothetical protein VGX91_08000 [Candidatus Cybelea sp.]|jgi:hypothetical protein|nr:hypothetical protein [Candidatus Cybelea sp.]